MQLTVLIFLHAVKKFHKLGGPSGLMAALNRLTSSFEGDERFEILILDAKDIACDSDALLGTADDQDYTKNLLRICAPVVKRWPQTTRVKYVLIHKLTDFSRTFDALTTGEAIKQRLTQWIWSLVRAEMDGGSIRVFNKQMNSISLLSDRTATGELVGKLCKEKDFAAAGLLWPEFYRYDSSLEPLVYPVIIKPNDASNVRAHWMTIVTNAGQWPFLSAENEFIKQQFYPHHGVLFKVYVIGEAVEIVVRPSISVSKSDLTAKDPISFHTHQFKLSEAALSVERAQHLLLHLYKPHGDLITRFVTRLQRILDLETFGVDIIVPEEADGRLRVAVIDINYFPGYDGVEDLAFKFVSSLKIDCAQK